MAALVKNRTLIAVIGDEDTVTGMLLTGIGNVDKSQNANFFVVDNRVTDDIIQDTFVSYTKNKNIAIILITQNVAERIRDAIDDYTAPFPTVLEIPSKDHPYDPNKDSILKRVQRLFSD